MWTKMSTMLHHGRSSPRRRRFMTVVSYPNAGILDIKSSRLPNEGEAQPIKWATQLRVALFVAQPC